MKIKFLMLALLTLPVALSGVANKCGQQIKVAVIDTGLDLDDPRFEGHLCETGHKNFVTDETLDDFNGHGTHVAGLIQKYAGNVNYCLLIYKFYEESAPGKVNQNREILALQKAVNNGATIVNFSGGGSEFNEAEYLIIKNNPQVTFVVAAGNEGQDLDVKGNTYYPASLFLPNMEVVANMGENGELVPSSNHSVKIKDKEVGDNVLSYLPNGEEGRMSGTSMSTAIFSGKLVDKTSKTCEYRK